MQRGCITLEAELSRIAPEWAALWRRVPDATPFQSPIWLMAWWHQFGNRAPRLLTLRAGGELRAILPLYLLNEEGCRKLLPLGIGLSDYFDALIDPAFPDGADVLLDAAAKTDGWDEFHLPDLPPGSALAAARTPADLHDSGGATVPCPVLELPHDAAAIATVVPKKTLRDVRQGASRAAAQGGVALDRADSDTLPAMLGELFRLHEARWQGRGETGVLADPLVRAFHRDAARSLHASGMLRLYQLRIGKHVAAVYYGFAWRDRAYAYIGGFDPELPRLSPGAQILHHAIGEAIAEGCTEFHFLRGGESYKYAWGAVDHWNTARTLTRA